RTGDTSLTHSVAFVITELGIDSAQASDFVGGTLPWGTVTFDAGETSKTITVNVASDTVVEPDEGFAVLLSDPSSGLAIDTAIATGTIVNDDNAAVSIAALSAAKPEQNSGTVSFTFTVTASQAAATPQSVD